MGYRVNCVPPDRSVKNDPSKSKIVVSNGSTADYAFPCWYLDIPYGMEDDVKIDLSEIYNDESEVKLRPIHFTEEGYESVLVAFDNAPSGITATGSIDEEEDWIIRIKFSSMCDDAVRRLLEIPFSVFISDGSGNRDIACSGTLIVLPGPYAG